MTKRKHSNKVRNMDDFIMRPTVDICFKNLMENAKVRKGFVAALLGRQPEEIAETQMLPTVLIGDSPDDKYGILDVHVLLNDGSHMNLEMQVKYFEYWDERVLYYLCSIFTDQLYEGDDYDKLEKCIHVSILDFNHFEDDICYRKIHLRDDETGKIYSDKLELQMLELSKLPPDVKSGEDVLAWMYFFSGENKEELETMAKKNEYIEEAYNTLVKLSADEEKRREYKAREKALRDYNSQINSAEKRGWVQGQEQGMRLTKAVFKLYESKYSIEEIAEKCDITIEQVREILG